MLALSRDPASLCRISSGHQCNRFQQSFTYVPMLVMHKTDDATKRQKEQNTKGKFCTLTMISCGHQYNSFQCCFTHQCTSATIWRRRKIIIHDWAILNTSLVGNLLHWWPKQSFTHQCLCCTSARSLVFINFHCRLVWSAYFSGATWFLKN